MRLTQLRGQNETKKRMVAELQGRLESAAFASVSRSLARLSQAQVMHFLKVNHAFVESVPLETPHKREKDYRFDFHVGRLTTENMVRLAN